jgi:EAL domain-containing protein (putative c-di-GMP-specific phosphodiesterase class I)
VLQPLDFLPLIENTPAAGLLTYFVIERVAAEFLDWLRANDAFISINIPPEIIGRGGLRYVAEKTGLMEVAAKIVLEITERGVPDQIAFEAIKLAADYGVRVALDDVGTGGENIIVLSRCNIPIIKLDRDLVGRVQPGAPLPREIDEIAHLLVTGKFEVIAEGVETAHQAEVLLGLGIKLAQGFYLAKPLPASAFKAFFATCAACPAAC